MTDTPQPHSEIAVYREAVERELADLPTAVRHDLISDLEAHLTEVASELGPDETLTDRLGSPEAYARELREAAELPAQMGQQPPRNSLADRYTESAGLGDFAEFRRVVRPGWWVFRGLALAALLGLWFHLVLGAYWPLSALVFAAMALGFVWLSVKIGTAATRWGSGLRGIAAVAGVALVALFLWTPFATGVNLSPDLEHNDEFVDGEFTTEPGYDIESPTAEESPSEGSEAATTLEATAEPTASPDETTAVESPAPDAATTS